VIFVKKSAGIIAVVAIAKTRLLFSSILGTMEMAREG